MRFNHLNLKRVDIIVIRLNILLFKVVNCHFGPCGLASFATLVQISNFLYQGPCGFTFVAILVKNSKIPIFHCCNLLFCPFLKGYFGHFACPTTHPTPPSFSSFSSAKLILLSQTFIYTENYYLIYHHHLPPPTTTTTIIHWHLSLHRSSTIHHNHRCLQSCRSSPPPSHLANRRERERGELVRERDDEGFDANFEGFDSVILQPPLSTLPRRSPPPPTTLSTSSDPESHYGPPVFDWDEDEFEGFPVEITQPEVTNETEAVANVADSVVGGRRWQRFCLYLGLF
ncbi:putative PAT complex subunit CCDC47 protein [Helianthus debilis subsp. tardiflorus]